ncbi:MAG: hypothetical protein IT210_07745 [Armatimonadetes bacterium]|nr:hypothetical protein [Armatimonadota bacterium]
MNTLQLQRSPLIFLVVFAAAVAGPVAVVLIDTLGNASPMLPPSDLSWPPAVLAATTFLGIGLFIFRLWPAHAGKWPLFLTAYAMRLAVGFTLSWIFQYDDERHFHEMAAGIASALDAGVLTAARGGYAQLIGVLYWVFGDSFLVAKAYNAFIGALLPFLLYDLALSAFPDRPRIAFRSLYFAIFLPPLLFYSGMNLKEMSTALAIVLSFWCLQVPSWPQSMRIAGALGGCFLIYYIRTGWFIFTLLGVIAYLLIGEKWDPSRLRTLHKSWSRLALAAMIVIGLLPLLHNANKYALWLVTRQYSSEMFKRTASRTTVGQFIDPREVLSPRNAVVLTLRASLTPSPLRVFFDSGITVVMEGLVMLTWYALFAFALIGLYTSWPDGKAISWAVAAMTMFIAAALASALGGDPYRHRISMLPLFYIFSAAGLEYKHRYWIVQGFWLLIIFFFTLLYIKLRS